MTSDIYSKQSNTHPFPLAQTIRELPAQHFRLCRKDDMVTVSSGGKGR